MLFIAYESKFESPCGDGVRFWIWRCRANSEANNESGGRARVRRPGGFEIGGRAAAGTERGRNSGEGGCGWGQSSGFGGALSQVRAVSRNQIARHSGLRHCRSSREGRSKNNEVQGTR